MVKRTAMLNRGLSAKVIKYFEERPGSTVHMDDLLLAIPGVDRNALQNAISFIKNRKGFQIDIVIAGQAYRYSPNGKPAEEPKPAKRVFEEIGQARDGSVIIQDETGNLYRAQEL